MMITASTLARWGVVAAVLLASGAAMLGVLSDPLSRSDHVEIPSDELLAYDLTPPGSVVVNLLPKAREISLSSWCIVGVSLPDQRFVYGIDVEWLGAGGKQLSRSELSFESRVSGDAEARDASEWAARLAYSNDAVTDSRTLRVLIPELGGERPAALRLRAHKGALRRVLVRTTYPEERGELELEAVERSLTPVDREELDRDRTSLPFDELPRGFRVAALAHWQRRLDASGVEGTDYNVERLLIGRGRAPAGLRMAQRAPQLVRAGRALAFNLFGTAEIELSAPTGAVLSWSDGQQPTPLLTVLGNEQRQRLNVGRPELSSTLVLRSPESIDVPVRVTLRREDAAAVIGDAQPAGSERLEIAPAWLRSPYYRLDPDQPAVVQMAPGQNMLGVTVRAYADRPRGWLEATLGSSTTRSEIALPPSEFERWLDGESASEEQELFLQVPQGVTQVELRGDAALYVTPFTYDPEIEEDRLAGPYQRPVPLGWQWRYADCDIRRRVSLRALDHERWIAEGRTLELRSQARVVEPPPREAQPEVTLVPRGSEVRRHLVLPLVRTPGRPPRETAWVTLDRERRGQVASVGVNAGKVRLRYRLAPEHLGQSLSLWVDGALALAEQPVTTAADVDLPVPPGEHRFELRGLPEGDAALLELAAAPREPLVRQRIVYRLLPGQTLEYRVDKQAESARLISFAYAERPAQVALSFSVQAQTHQQFASSHSKLAGRLQGAALPAQGAWFWETTEPGQLSEYRDGITLGADLVSGPVVVKLKNESRARLWLSLVLVGQGPSPTTDLEHFWALEER